MDDSTLTIILGTFSTISTFVIAYLGVKVKRSEVISNGNKITNQAVNDLIKNLQLEITRISEEKKLLEKKIERDSERISELEKKDIHKTHRMMLLESAHNDKPFPEWLKDVDGTMLSLNPMYEKKFLLPQNLKNYDYIGKDDSAAWNVQSVSDFKKNDDDAKLSSKKYIFAVEELFGKDGSNMGKWLVLKFLREFNGIKVGVGGQCFPLKPILDILDELNNEVDIE